MLPDLWSLKAKAISTWVCIYTVWHLTKHTGGTRQILNTWANKYDRKMWWKFVRQSMLRIKNPYSVIGILCILMSMLYKAVHLFIWQIVTCIFYVPGICFRYWGYKVKRTWLLLQSCLPPSVGNGRGIASMRTTQRGGPGCESRGLRDKHRKEWPHQFQGVWGTSSEEGTFAGSLRRMSHFAWGRKGLQSWESHFQWLVVEGYFIAIILIVTRAADVYWVPLCSRHYPNVSKAKSLSRGLTY